MPAAWSPGFSSWTAPFLQYFPIVTENPPQWDDHRLSVVMPKEPTPSAAKIRQFFENKTFSTLIAFVLVVLVFNLQPNFESLLSLSSPCPAGVSTSSVQPVAVDSVGAAATPKRMVFTSPPADPNKRTFRAYGSAAALFVQMGAYRGGERTFAVVGLASKPTHVFDRPWYKCEWIPNNGNSSVRAKANRILPDWGYGRVYTVVVVNCTFTENPNADNGGGKLILYAYYDESPRRFEKFTALEEAPGEYDESNFRPPYKYEYLYCGSSLYGNLSAARMREWMAYHACFFGPSSHFVFHDAGGVSAEVRAVLEPWIRSGRVTVQDIRAQAEYDGYYYNQFLVVNDCLHRHRHAANWTFFFDVDEYLYLPGGETLESVVRDFSNNTQFTIEQNAMSSFLCPNDSSHDFPSEWGFEKLVFRDSRRIRRDRKYAIQAKNAYAAGVHMSENVAGKTLHATGTRIRYHHYHNSITFHDELCRKFADINGTTWVDKIPFVYDDSMKKLAPVIKRSEHTTAVRGG